MIIIVRKNILKGPTQEVTVDIRTLSFTRRGEKNPILPEPPSIIYTTNQDTNKHIRSEKESGKLVL